MGHHGNKPRKSGAVFFNLAQILAFLDGFGATKPISNHCDFTYKVKKGKYRPSLSQ